MKNTVFIGSVLSSKAALETLIEQGVKIDLVCSLDEAAATNVSDYYPVHRIAEKFGLRYVKFRKVTDAEVVCRIREAEPDFIFVSGVSQIIPPHMLGLAREYTVGFHPTPLPRYRGRAALPWMILLGEKNLKATILKLDQGMDSGDIICQVPYEIGDTDYVTDVYGKVCRAMQQGLAQCLPDIYGGTVRFIPQDEEEATYLMIRRPEDGKIQWHLPAADIARLVRAASRPYPGAFTGYGGKRLVIWRAHAVENRRYIGLPGQIAWVRESGELGVLTGDGILVVTEHEHEGRLLAGHRLL